MSPVPVLLVTGFLGAGKTTLINRLLRAAHGRRIAAIVNDFGAINIDAEILGAASDRVIGLQNGCICCSLQGDLLRSLRLVLRHEPELIVIEASGVADPRGIAAAIGDPVLWRAVALDAIVALVDLADLAETPARMEDPLWRAQLAAADMLLLAKTAGAPDALRARLATEWRRPLLDLDREPLPEALLLGGIGGAAHVTDGGAPLGAGRFVTMDWACDGPVALAPFRQAMGRLAPLRAKGWLTLRDRPGQGYLFQLVGRRADFRPAPVQQGCRLVLIGEAGALDPDTARAALDALS